MDGGYGAAATTPGSPCPVRDPGGGAAAHVRDEPHPVPDGQPRAGPVPHLRVLGALPEHVRAGRVGDAAGGELDAALVDLVEPGPVVRDPAGCPAGRVGVRCRQVQQGGRGRGFQLVRVAAQHGQHRRHR